MKRYFFFISVFFILFLINSLGFSNFPTIQKLSGPDGNVLYQVYVFTWNATSTEGSIIGYQYKKDSENWVDTTEATYTWNDIPRGSHTFSVKALDKNNQYSNPITWEFSNEITFPDMLLSSDSQIIKITDNSTSLTGLTENYNYYFDSNSDRLIIGSNFYEYDGISFNHLNSFTLESGEPIIGYGKILKVNNTDDIANVYNFNGDYIKTISLIATPTTRNQSCAGFFLDENNFVLSDDGLKNIAKFNILSEEKTIISTPENGWNSSICKSDNYYYVYNSRNSSIYRIKKSQIQVKKN